MTIAENLRQLLKQPNGEQLVQQYIKELLASPETRHEIAEIAVINKKSETL